MPISEALHALFRPSNKPVFSLPTTDERFGSSQDRQPLLIMGPPDGKICVPLRLQAYGRVFSAPSTRASLAGRKGEFMKPGRIPRLATGLCLVLLLGRPPLRAEESSTRPSSYDAVAAAPDNHRVVFENEKVRVLEVTINPGEKEPFHEHPLFSVMNIITGAPLRITSGPCRTGKSSPEKRLKLPRTIFNLRRFGCLLKACTQRRTSGRRSFARIASS